MKEKITAVRTGMLNSGKNIVKICKIFIPLAEKLCVAVDIQKGSFLLSLGEHYSDLTDDIEECLNTDHRDLRQVLSR